ncbi:MAG: YcaO-like family protein [bacterium]|nr:YcaO-like family protein [bacterium]
MEYSKKKDLEPLKTVNKITSILNNIDLKVIMSDFIKISDSIDEQPVFSLQIGVLDGVATANGKGTTKEYTLASAHAELIERLQNGLFTNIRTIKTPTTKKIKIEDYLSDDKNCGTNDVFRYLFVSNVFENVDFDKDIKDIVYQIQKSLTGKAKSDLYCEEFYDVKNKKTVYLPLKAITRAITSNGMSAGNTKQEALIQGLSEIIERYCQNRIIKDKISCPIIPPEEYLCYDSLAKMIDFYKKYGFEVEVRDASLGEGYPSVCVIFKHLKTNKYTSKFAANPSFPVAIERCLTEFAQGYDLKLDISQATVAFFDYDYDFGLSDVDLKSILLLYNTSSFPLGKAFFKNKPSWNFDKKVWYDESLSNEEILKLMISLILDKSFDIYIRDVSFLGFPSFHIYIPQMSNLAVNVFEFFKPFILHVLPKINEKCKTVDEWTLLELCFNNYWGIYLSMNYQKQNYKKCLEIIDYQLKTSNNERTIKEVSFIKELLTIMKNGISEAKAYEMIKIKHDDAFATSMLAYLKGGEDVIINYLSEVYLKDEKSERTKDRNARLNILTKIIEEQSMKNPIVQDDLKELFE